MLLIITSILIFLVVINFILLLFSCNKTSRRRLKALNKNKKVVSVLSTKSEVENQLAPTGS
jgi:hypothetical protein